MYYYFHGELVKCEPSFVAVECGGVAYRLTVSLNTSSALSDKVGEVVKVYANQQVREDSIELFGFVTEEELEAFKLLLGVSGVGPKAAMAVLSLLDPPRFMLAVCTEDVKAISKASGVGAKTAARIVLELKDKISKDFAGAGTLSSAVSTTLGKAAPKMSGKLSEATEALSALGYDKHTIQRALGSINTDQLTVEQIITQALKSFL